MTRTILLFFIIIAIHAQQLVVYAGLASCEHFQHPTEQMACHQEKSTQIIQDHYCQHCNACKLCQVISFNFTSNFTKTLAVALYYPLNQFQSAHFYQFFPQTLLRPPQSF